MTNPYEMLGEHRGVLAWIAVAISTIMFCWLTYHGRELSEHVDSGILALEFASNQTDANEVLDDLNVPSKHSNRTLREVAIANVRWDYLFIVAYVAAIAVVCGFAAKETDGTWSVVLITLAWLQVAAGGLDVVENLCMTSMLQAGSVASSTIPLVTSLCAKVKFFIALTGAGFGILFSAFALCKR